MQAFFDRSLRYEKPISINELFQWWESHGEGKEALE
jgi:hypothetical protein